MFYLDATRTLRPRSGLSERRLGVVFRGEWAIHESLECDLRNPLVFMFSGSVALTVRFAKYTS